jgi:hypothetical protein
MRKEEVIVIRFVLSHIVEHPAKEAAGVLYALASLTSDNARRIELFERAKQMEGQLENAQETGCQSDSEQSDSQHVVR